MHRPPEQMPDPWLFNTETLLRELARCPEMVLLIPATDCATHMATNNAIDAIWNLEENLRFLLHLHRAGQRSFSRRHRPSDSASIPIRDGVLAPLSTRSRKRNNAKAA